MPYLNWKQPEYYKTIRRDVEWFFKNYQCRLEAEKETIINNKIVKLEFDWNYSDVFNHKKLLKHLKTNCFSPRRYLLSPYNKRFQIDCKKEVQHLIGIFMFLYGENCNLNLIDCLHNLNYKYFFKQKFYVKELKTQKEVSFSLTKFNGKFDKWLFDKNSCIEGMFCDSNFNQHEINFNNIFNNYSFKNLFLNSKLNKNIFLVLRKSTCLENLFRNSKLTNENIEKISVLNLWRFDLGMFKDSKIDVNKCDHLFFDFYEDINYYFNRFYEKKSNGDVVVYNFQDDEIYNFLANTTYQEMLLIENISTWVKFVWKRQMPFTMLSFIYEFFIDKNVNELEKFLNNDGWEVKEFLKWMSNSKDKHIQKEVEIYKSLFINLGFIEQPLIKNNGDQNKLLGKLVL